MTDFKSQKIKQVIKDLLKKKSITYETIAEQLECSIPTVKRILGPEELTLTRLIQLCEIVEIDFAELELLTKEQETVEEKFTPEQETFLAKNPSFLAYLLKLFSGDTPKQIAEKYDLTIRSTDKYLLGLEKLGLIHVTARQKVKPTFKAFPRLDSGPLGQLHSDSVVNTAARFFIEVAREGMRLKKSDPEAPRPKALWGVHSAKVTKASYEAWIAEREAAQKNFERLSAFEEKTKPETELMTAVIVGAHTLLENNYKALKIFENLFGEVKNL